MATTTVAVDNSIDNATSSAPVMPNGAAGAPLSQISSSVSSDAATAAATGRPPANSCRKTVADSDESTPIKQSDRHESRKYSTSSIVVPASSARGPAKPGAVTHDDRALDVATTEHRVPWYRRIADKYGSITLENKGSVARDHLALERTFLAWLRTSLSFASIGIAITQLFRLNTNTPKSPLGRPRAVTEDVAATSDLPLSPFLGHAVPAEMLPYLQHMVADLSSDVPSPALGPTLLDQVLRLTSEGNPVAAVGVSAAQIDVGASNRLKHVGKPLGATFIGISVLVLLVGFQRYFEAQHWIVHGKFPASRGGISLVAFVAFALIIASLIIVIVVSPTSYER